MPPLPCSTAVLLDYLVEALRLSPSDEPSSCFERALLETHQGETHTDWSADEVSEPQQMLPVPLCHAQGCASCAKLGRDVSLDFLHRTPRGEMRAVPTPTSTCRRAVAHFVRVCFGAQPLPRLAPAEKRSDHAMSTRALWYFFVLGLMWATKEESCFVLGGNGAYPGMCEGGGKDLMHFNTPTIAKPRLSLSHRH